jgi:hypothetical protein
MTITKSEKVKFLNPIFANACTIDLLIQHKFCCVILIDRSWRTWKMTQITPTYLRIATIHHDGKIWHDAPLLNTFLVHHGRNNFVKSASISKWVQSLITTTFKNTQSLERYLWDAHKLGVSTYKIQSRSKIRYLAHYTTYAIQSGRFFWGSIGHSIVLKGPSLVRDRIWGRMYNTRQIIHVPILKVSCISYLLIPTSTITLTYELLPLQAPPQPRE